MPRWLGKAVDITNKWTITIANNWAGADTATVTINGQDLTITVGSLTTTAQVAQTLKEAWESEEFTDTTATVSPIGGGKAIPEHSRLTASVSGSVVTLEAVVPGEPWTITASESTAGTGTATAAEATAATGRNWWSNADNWSAGAVPVSTDEVQIDVPVDILYGIDQNAVDLGALEILPGFGSARIGLPNVNKYGYAEFRDRYLKIGVTTCTVNCDSPLLRLNFDSTQTTCYVRNTGTVPAEPGHPSLSIVGTSTSNTFRVYKGSVGLGMIPGETTRASVLSVGQRTLSTDATVYIGPGCAVITTINLLNGTLICTVGVMTTTTFAQWGGVSFIDGLSHVLTTANIYKGVCYYNSNSTITTLTVGPGATFSRHMQIAGCTITNANFYDGYNVDDPSRQITWTNNPTRYEVFPAVAHP